MENIELKIVKNIKLEDLKFIDEYIYKPYIYFKKHLKEEAINKNFIHLLNDFKDKKDHYILKALNKDKIVGVSFFSVSSWDSKVFGFNYGSINYVLSRGDYKESHNIKAKMISYIINWADEKGVDFFHARANVLDLSLIHSLEESRFRFISNISRYIKKNRLSSKPNLKEYDHIFNAIPSDSKDLREISKQNFTDNRFFLDENFKRNCVDKLYFEWIKNSISGKIQDKVFVYKRLDKVLGFATCGKKRFNDTFFNKDIGAIDLVGISKGHQGAGIGLKVVSSCISWLNNNTDLTEAVMASQNLPMIRILEKFGFSIASGQIDFHWWRSK